MQYIAGGATQNAIRVAQWMVGVPGATSFFGGIGVDDFGAQLKACAAADGVNAYYKEDPDTPTGACAGGDVWGWAVYGWAEFHAVPPFYNATPHHRRQR